MENVTCYLSQYFGLSLSGEEWVVQQEILGSHYLGCAAGGLYAQKKHVENVIFWALTGEEIFLVVQQEVFTIWVVQQEEPVLSFIF